MAQLAKKTCVPCRGGALPLRGATLRMLKDQIDESWEIINDHHLLKTFTFKDFKRALAFTISAGEIAEREGHHPDIYLSWGKVVIKIWTHKIEGLTESDFILAAKFDETISR